MYRSIGAEGFARIDFLVTGERIVVSEINTIPGFTPISLFPTMPAAGGYSFADVVDKVVALAIERHETRVGGSIEPEDLPLSLAYAGLAGKLFAVVSLVAGGLGYALLRVVE